MNILPVDVVRKQSDELLQQMLKNWLELPITKGLILAIDRQRKNLLDAMAKRALDKDYTTEHFRLLAAQLSTVQQINNILTDANTYINATTDSK